MVVISERGYYFCRWCGYGISLIFDRYGSLQGKRKEGTHMYYRFREQTF